MLARLRRCQPAGERAKPGIGGRASREGDWRGGARVQRGPPFCPRHTHTGTFTRLEEHVIGALQLHLCARVLGVDHLVAALHVGGAGRVGGGRRGGGGGRRVPARSHLDALGRARGHHLAARGLLGGRAGQQDAPHRLRLWLLHPDEHAVAHGRHSLHLHAAAGEGARQPTHARRPARRTWATMRHPCSTPALPPTHISGQRGGSAHNQAASPGGARCQRGGGPGGAGGAALERHGCDGGGEGGKGGRLRRRWAPICAGVS